MRILIASLPFLNKWHNIKRSRLTVLYFHRRGAKDAERDHFLKEKFSLRSLRLCGEIYCYSPVGKLGIDIESINPGSYSNQQKLISTEFLINFFGIAQQHVHLIPEPPAVIFDASMNQFMQYRVIDQFLRQSNQVHI